MSDLQIGLGMLGIVVVAAVFGFNWWQERQFRRRAEEAFADRHGDILLDQPAAAPVSSTQSRADVLGEARIEPKLDSAPGASFVEPPGEAARFAGDLPQPEIDYVVEIRAGELIAPARIAALRGDLSALGRNVTFGGFDYRSKAWEALSREDARYTSLRAAIQLVDRSGPLTGEQLQRFADAVVAAAQEMAAIVELPELAPSLERAAHLDQFCAEVDVLVGINVIARAGQVFHGTKIRALAEASGLQLQATGTFQLGDDQENALFSLDNQEPEPLTAEKIRTLTTPGITFLLDVPRVANGLRVFDRMVAMSRSFADSLDGIIADDNRVPLNDSGLEKIRDQLRAIYASMERHGMQAGSPLALRLFS